MNAPHLLKIEEVAERLSLSVQHVYKLASRGDFAIVKIGSSLRVSETALALFIEERTHSPRPTRPT
jgi:excisionase family DNA binding protein